MWSTRSLLSVNFPIRPTLNLLVPPSDLNLTLQQPGLRRQDPDAGNYSEEDMGDYDDYDDDRESCWSPRSSL